MALTAGSIITASDFNSLKTRVNTEMARRSYTGSLASYNTSVTVSAGGVATAAQGQSIVNAVRAISTTDMPASPSTGSLIKALDTVSTKLTDYASRALVGTSSGCASSCSGLCQGCNNTCTGSCSSTCTGDCTGGCSSTCTGSCTGSCSSTCTGGCSGCSGSCGTGCGSGCESGCWGCSGQCSGTSCGWKGL